MTQDPRYSPGGDKSSQAWPRWMIVVVPLLVVVVVAGLWWALIAPKESETLDPAATPSVVAEMLPHASPTALTGEQAGLLSTPEPTATGLLGIEPSPTPSEVGEEEPETNTGETVYLEGEMVVVHGTEGAGLRMRMGAGTGYDRIKTLSEGSVLEIVGGPKEAEQLVWYQVRDQTGTTGWVASDYIQLQQE